ncbi:TnsA endonuclease N-terminal domain-containing protein [Peribacillus asahii]|uniref:TnsA endonuclease N-terminal domain-containing protein n=1 Tax=Peribacillus asahii TaxID=228899 RepID=UPI002079ED22|nr:TnsA endonuclease N-terminal domain-containing protein [Peribacillus asahii]USK60400.1 TnsA endonuclease N-terminal domain-containing protein [Peribacillus asahii]
MIQDSYSIRTKRLIAEGRGQGVGADYIPWTKTHEFSSKGRATRLLGIKTGRIHHLQSDNQYRAFLIFEFSEKVSDIRETYPLLDALEVMDNVDDLRFDKFQDKETKDPFVITTNFLLTVVEPDRSEKYVARTVKNSSELKRKMTWEKLEIERRYWLQKGIEWKIITEKQLPRQLAKNIEWIRETLLEGSEGDLDKERLSITLLRYLLENDEVPLKEILKLFDKQEDLQKGSGLFLFRYLLAKKEICIDMSKTIDFSLSVRDINLK